MTCGIAQWFLMQFGLHTWNLVCVCVSILPQSFLQGQEAAATEQKAVGDERVSKGSMSSGRPKEAEIGKEMDGELKSGSRAGKEEEDPAQLEEAQGEDEEEPEEPEEVDVFECKAGTDIKELGLMPSAFAPDPVEIASVTPDSWAAKSGIEAGDVLIKINGTAVEAMDRKEMKRAMRDRPLSLTISRQAFATPAESIDDMETIECTAPEGVQDLGLYPSAFPPEAMIVANVTPGSWAEKQGIEAGDELVEIGHQQVQDMTTKETKRAMRDRPLHLVFQRVQDPPASAPASSAPTSERKSQKPAPDMTQATNEARKSAAILPEGFNPASDRRPSCTEFRGLQA